MLQSPRLNATVWYPVFQRFLLNFVPWCEMPDRGICNIIMTNCTQFHLLGVDKQGKEEMEGLMSMTQAQWDEWAPSLLAGWARDLINKFHYLDPTLVRVQLFEVQTATPSALRGRPEEWIDHGLQASSNPALTIFYSHVLCGLNVSVPLKFICWSAELWCGCIWG